MTSPDINLNIRDLKFEQTEIGRLIKGSKLIYTWEMILDDIKRKVELIHSRITGKRRISLDGRNLAKHQKYTFEFSYTFMIDKHFINMIQTSPDTYELRIDNVSFSNLMNKEKLEKFTKKKNDVIGRANVVSQGGSAYERRDKHTLTEIHQIEDDFYKKEKPLELDDWNFGENNRKILVKAGNDNFFDDKDFDFDDVQGSKGERNEINGNTKFGHNFPTYKFTTTSTNSGQNVNNANNNQNKNANLLDFDVKETSEVSNNKKSENLMDLNFIDFQGGTKADNNTSTPQNNQGAQNINQNFVNSNAPNIFSGFNEGNMFNAPTISTTTPQVKNNTNYDFSFLTK